MTTVAVLTPYRQHGAIDLGNRLWRTQLLPLGEIDYKGRKLQFTKDYFAGLIAAFKAAAFNQVPFQLADGDNKHNNDPERFRGEIKDLTLDEDGLNLVLEATEDGDKLLKTNPKLGVSARIFENYERSDGKKWAAALQHVLGTLDPHITGMKPWQQVAALSNEGGARVLDLTEATYESEEDKPVQLTKAQLADLLKQMRDGGKDISDEDLDEILEAAEGEGGSDELTDEELEAIIAEAEADSAPPAPTSEPTSEPVAAANQTQAALELAALRASNEQQSIELAQVRARLDEQAFSVEKEALVRGGLPPKTVELARPLLQGSDHVVELSNGDQIDAGQVMRRVLVELANTVKVLDLGNLLGRGEDDPDAADEEKKRQDDLRNFVDTEKKRLGLDS
jgi:hypothetical protein